MNTIEQFYSEAGHKIPAFDAFTKKHALTQRTRADHICYKCGSCKSFERLRGMLEEHSAYLYQSVISQRRIAYIKFKQPIKTALGPIIYLELSDQKPDGSQIEGFDHIEVYPTSISYEELVGELSATEKVVHIERPHHTTDDIELPNGFTFRCTAGPLIEKITREEMI